MEFADQVDIQGKDEMPTLDEALPRICKVILCPRKRKGWWWEGTSYQHSSVLGAVSTGP